MAQHWAQSRDRHTGVAVVVADAGSGAVLAHLGSPDFFDGHRAGQVDMTRAVRSPGATLKPLLYGLAFDAGFLHPPRIVTDAPLRISGSAPANFPQAHLGAWSAAHAART